MQLDSPLFLGLFLPLLVLLQWVIRGDRGRNYLLLTAGLLFCAFGSLSGIPVLLAAVLVNYWIGLGLQTRPGSRILLISGVVLNLTLLGVYKYLAFFLGGLFGLPTVFSGWSVPLGISFFTFKCISYLVDVARNPAVGTRSYPDLLLYVSFFPQMVSGPISRFPDFSAQLTGRDVNAGKMAAGFRRFVCGMGKKLLLAYPMSRVADGVFGFSGHLSAVLAWAGAVAYMLQIYFDFSGYSDMAIGLGQMFGFRSPENFNVPYMASSVTDFWRRWHISLSAWFRDYVYIPLGGNRKGKGRAAWNKLIVFALCGFWHGASWTFLLWGIWHGVFIALETLDIIPTKRMEQSPAGRILSHAYALTVVLLGFVLFRSPDLSGAVNMAAAMFGGGASTETAVMLHSLVGRRDIITGLACVCLCFPLGKRLVSVFPESSREPVFNCLTLVLLAVCLCASAAIGFQPFIYAQF